MGRKFTKILGIALNGTSTDQVLNQVSASLKKKRKFYIVTPNPEIVVAAQKDKILKNALNKADIALPDGVGLVLVAKFLKLKPQINRLRGREVMIELFKLASKKRLRIFLVGSSKEVINRSLEKIKNEFPKIVAKGYCGPNLNKNALPVSEVDRKLQKDALDKINKCTPDLLFIAFGAPKQEKWVARHLPKIKVGGAMVVGGALDYYSGLAKLPPLWLADLGFEWLWRLINNPKRIKRIFNATVVFPVLVMREILKNE